MNFVWLYEGSRTDELALSIQLVKHFYPTATTYIISTRRVTNIADQLLQPLRKLGNKHADQLYKLREALKALPDEFYVMNDDFFLTAPMEDDGDINGRLSALQDRRQVHDAYRAAIGNTIEMLDQLQFPLWNFELHKPLFVQKSEMEKAFALLIDQEEPAILWRSLYGNTALLGHKPAITDAKDVKGIPFGSSWMVSTDGYSFPRYRFKLREILNG